MTEPVVLINLFSMPADMVDAFVTRFESTSAAIAQAPGFRGTRLHRSVDPDARFPVVNIAQWDSVEDWQAAIGQAFLPAADAQRSTAGPVSTHPALYTVVHSTPDPLEAAS